MVSYESNGTEHLDHAEILKLFSGDRLVDALVDMIEWIHQEREAKGNFEIELPDDYFEKLT